MSDETNKATPTQKHTPGKWEVISKNFESGIKRTVAVPYDRGEYYQIAIVSGHLSKENGGEELNEANAALIASAPSLLAKNEKMRGLLKRSSEWLEKTGAYTNYQPDFNEIMVLIGEIAAALSGEQKQ